MSGNFAPGRFQAATSAEPEFAGLFAKIELVPGKNSNRLSFRDKIGFLLAKIFGMRKAISEPSFPNSTDIGAIKPNAKSRDDISALPIGFQATYADGAVPLHPEARIIPGCRLDTVRTGSAFLDGSVSDLSASEDGLQDSGGLLSSGPDFA